MSEKEYQLFEQLALRNMEHLYSKAIRLAGNASSAEGLVQRTFASAYDLFPQFDKTNDFNLWLEAILLHSYAKFVQVQSGAGATMA
jgi:RNA polymerase sigma-70 factor, ECF subfamily